MKNKNIIKLFAFLWSALLIVSCSNEDLDRKDGPTVPEGLPVTMKLNIGTPDVTVVETKAVENGNNTFGIINNLAVLVYDEKGENPIVTYKSGTEITPGTSVSGINFDAKTGKRRIYVLTNVGSKSAADYYKTEADLLKEKRETSITPTGNEMMLGCVVAGSGSNAMEASSAAYYEGRTTEIDIKAEGSFSARVIPPYSKITFKITKDLPDMDKVYLNIHNVNVRKLPKCYTFMSLSGENADNRLSTQDISGKKEINVDLKQVENEGYSFYMYENKQGIFPNNRGDAYKSPGINVPETSSSINYENWYKLWDDLACTYIEVEGKYSIVTSSNTVKVGDIHYRFFLGENTTTDFNVKRNTNYIVSLNFTENAGYDELKHEWRVHAVLDEATFIPEGDLVIDGYQQGIGYVPFYVANSTAGEVTVETSSPSSSEMMMYFNQGGTWGPSSAADFKNFSVKSNSITEYAIAPNDGGIIGSRSYDGGDTKFIAWQDGFDENLSSRTKVGNGSIYNMRTYTIKYTPTSTKQEETSKLIVKELPLLLISNIYEPNTSGSVYARRVDGAYLSQSTVDGNYAGGGRNQYFTRADSKAKARRICSNTIDIDNRYSAASVSVGALKSFLPTSNELKKIIEFEKYAPLKSGQYWTMDGLFDVSKGQIVSDTGTGYIRCVARVL